MLYRTDDDNEGVQWQAVLCIMTGYVYWAVEWVSVSCRCLRRESWQNLVSGSRPNVVGDRRRNPSTWRLRRHFTQLCLRQWRREAGAKGDIRPGQHFPEGGISRKILECGLSTPYGYLNTLQLSISVHQSCSVTFKMH